MGLFIDTGQTAEIVEDIFKSVGEFTPGHDGLADHVDLLAFVKSWVHRGLRFRSSWSERAKKWGDFISLEILSFRVFLFI
jgi:hypothetical protein